MTTKDKLLMASGFFESFEKNLYELAVLRKQVEEKENVVISELPLAEYWISTIRDDLETKVECNSEAECKSTKKQQPYFSKEDSDAIDELYLESLAEEQKKNG